MMKNDFKSKLIQAANKQQINDNSDEIIRRVDVTKVKEVTPVYKKDNHYRFIPLAIGGIALASAVVAVGVTIGLSNNKGVTIPSTPANGQMSTDTTPIDYTDISSDTTKQLLSKISTRETYNMINAAYTFNNVTFDKFDVAENASMTSSMEAALVNDFNDYIYNIEDMYGMVDSTICVVSDNKNVLYKDYSYDVEVKSPYYNYHIYYNEVCIYEKNVNQENYKAYSSLDGVIVIGGFEYAFESEKTIKNDNVEFVSKITIDENKDIEIRSLFTSDRSKFWYTYNYDNQSKDVYIEQKYDDGGNTSEIEFNSRNKTFQLVVKQEDNTLKCKIKSRDDSFVVAKNGNNYSYTFKKSENVYTK